MKTTLTFEGKIGIPEEIREADHLTAGDSFELERLMSGHYLLIKQPGAAKPVIVATADDGLPIIRVEDGVITSRLVKDIEGRIP